MPRRADRTDIPILLLHNVDPTWTAAEQAEAAQLAAKLQTALAEHGHPIVNQPVVEADLQGALSRHDPRGCVVLNWCEGLPGVPHSESQAVEALERLGFTYTGSPPEVLALTWSKPQVKARLADAGVPTPQGCLFERPEPDGWTRFPAIVKPAEEHCSLGVTTESVVLEPAELARRVAFVLDTYHQPALVEDFIDGREFHVTVWGNGVVRILPPVEMDFAEAADLHDRLCTFDSKFTPGSWHYEHIHLRVPAALAAAELARLERTCIRAYRAVGCRDYARLDLRLRDGEFLVLDVNANPDISPDTSMAYAAAQMGIDYGALASRLVNLAAQRHPVFGRQPAREGPPARVVLAASRRAKPAARASRPRLARTVGQR